MQYRVYPYIKWADWDKMVDLLIFEVKNSKLTMDWWLKLKCEMLIFDILAFYIEQNDVEIVFILSLILTLDMNLIRADVLGEQPQIRT